MGPTRFPYGQGKGFVNNFNYRGGTANLFAASDATPDVTIGDLFYTNNASATILTYFDLQDYANRASNYEGKVITVFFLDAVTQIANAGQLFLASSNNLLGANNSITLMHSRSGWYELDRSYVNRTEVQTYTIAAQSSINLDGTKVAIVTNTGAGSVFLSAFSGGQVGQSIILMPGTSGLSLFVQTGGNIAIQGTNAYLMASSGAYQFVKRATDRWTFLTIGSTGIA